MSKRMWAGSWIGSQLETAGKKGHFDVAYGEDEAQQLDIWYPDVEKEAYPVIVMIHGGGFVALDKRNAEMSRMVSESVKRGYAVASLNYRFADKVKFPEPIRDIKRAIRFIKANAKQYQLDAEKMVTWGGSAGGYFTLMSACFENVALFDDPSDPNANESAKIQGAIAWYPISEFITLDHQLKQNSLVKHSLKIIPNDVHECYVAAFPESEEDAFPMHETQDSCITALLGKVCHKESVLAQIASPIHYIHQQIPPMYLQHGTGDEIVPFQQSLDFTIKANEICQEERVKCDMIQDAIHGSLRFEEKTNVDKIFQFIESIL